MTDMKSLLPNWENHFEWRYVYENFPPCRMLDYGCGYGYSDIYLAKEGFSVFGYDPDDERISVAESMRSDMTDEIKGRIAFSSAGIWDGIYDLVWSSHVLEHVPYSEWVEILENILCGDAAIVSVPLGHAYDMPGHIHHWESGDELREKLEEYSGMKWKTSVDENNLVIRARWEKNDRKS